MPTVNVPGLTRSSWSLVQASALGLALVLLLAAGVPASSGAQAAVPARASRVAISAVRTRTDMAPSGKIKIANSRLA